MAQRYINSYITREDTSKVSEMVAAGWEPIYKDSDENRKDQPHNSISFQKGTRVVWYLGYCYGWQSAELINDRYENHIYSPKAGHPNNDRKNLIPSLKEVLKRY